MYKDRGANIRQRQEEIKRLEEENKRMEEEIERVRKIRDMEMEKEKLRQQMASLKVDEKKKKDIAKTGNLRGYAAKVRKETEEKAKKKLDKIKLQDSSPSEPEDNDTENIKYFLSLLSLTQYYDVLAQNKITSLAKLRQVNEAQAKSMGIPLKDMIKINKKLRTMGF